MQNPLDGNARGGPDSGEPPNTRRKTLLIVDDEEGPRQSLRLVFEDQYRVLLAAGGAEAMAIARREHIDGAVLDFLMGDMNGTQLLEQLKTIDPSMEVIILTGHASLDSARDAVRFGACEYLTKPYEIADILRSVTRMMDRHVLSERTQSNQTRLQQLEQELNEWRARKGGPALAEGEYGQAIDQINRPLTLIVGLLHILNRKLASTERLEGEAIEDFKERLNQINREADDVIDRLQSALRTARRAQAEGSTHAMNEALSQLEGASATLLKGAGNAASGRTLEQMEKEAIIEALRRHGGNKLAAAKELGITRQTLYNKLRTYQLES